MKGKLLQLSKDK